MIHSTLTYLVFFFCSSVSVSINSTIYKFAIHNIRLQQSDQGKAASEKSWKYESSDDSSDSDDDVISRKIHVKIRPKDEVKIICFSMLRLKFTKKICDSDSNLPSSYNWNSKLKYFSISNWKILDLFPCSIIILNNLIQNYLLLLLKILFVFYCFKIYFNKQIKFAFILT